MSTRLPAQTWHKSSYSGTNADCVECSSAIWHAPAHGNDGGGAGVEYAQHPTSVAVRDSKHPVAGHLAFPGLEWSAFLTAVRGANL